jgi:hypothetical protein
VNVQITSTTHVSRSFCITRFHPTSTMMNFDYTNLLNAILSEKPDGNFIKNGTDTVLNWIILSSSSEEFSSTNVLGGDDSAVSSLSLLDTSDTVQPACEVCGWLAAFCSMLAFGSFGVPIKSKAARSVDIDPLVFQSYKTILCFVTSWIVLLVTNEQFSFTPWGIVSGLFWVPGYVPTLIILFGLSF